MSYVRGSWRNGPPEKLEPFCLWDLRAMYRDAHITMGRISAYPYVFCSVVIFVAAALMMIKAWYQKSWYFLILDVILVIIVAALSYRNQSPRDRAVINRCGLACFIISVVLELAGFFYGDTTIGGEHGARVILMVLGFVYTSYFLSAVVTTGTSMVLIKRAGGSLVNFTFEEQDEENNGPSEASLHGVKKVKKKKTRKK